MTTLINRIQFTAQVEAALAAARIPLGEVKRLADTASEDWAVAREAFVSVAVGDEQFQVPRSPFRFSAGVVGPRAGAAPRGADNRSALKELLKLSDAEVDALEASGVLSAEDVG